MIFFGLPLQYLIDLTEEALETASESPADGPPVSTFPSGRLISDPLPK